jgi:hypothetical protein
MNNKAPYLTKSRFMNGLACPKWLWLGWHKPLPYEEPEAGSIQAVGTDIGIHATQLFPTGILIDEKAWEHKKAIERTACLVNDQSVSSIYEAAFEYDNVRIRVDILERLSDGSWGIREVKSSTSVKDDYINDLAVQLYVLEGCNVPITSIELVHINNQYIHQVGDVDWEQFFTRADRREEVLERLNLIPSEVKSLHGVMEKEDCPDISAGPKCSGYCPYWSHCTEDKPKEDWILTLPRLSAEKFDRLEAMGVEHIKDIPLDFPLNTTQETVRQTWLSGEDFISEDLHIGLKDFGPPAYYLDFETMAPAIPIYKGTRPFQRQPFQWSLHFDDGSGELQHWEFLGTNDIDPRRAFSETLIEACGQNELPIIVYSSFERSVIGEMTTLFPDLANGLNRIVDRLKDLLPITRGYTYFRKYKGSFSIKAVGPTLAPAVNYKGLDLIADGGAASSSFALISGGYITDAEQITALREALLAYCNLDTLAMVEVHRALQKLISKSEY